MGEQDIKEKSEAIDEEGLSSEPTLMRCEIRACSIVIDDDETEILTNFKVMAGGIDKGFESFCSDMLPEDKVKEKETVDTSKAMNIGDCAAEKNLVEVSDNAVLRKLLRGPRYFDTPDKSWGTCYNCGEEGHNAVNCTSAKRKKPCFVCGSFEHNAKHCAKGKACFICKKGGHRANNCPEKSHGGSQSSKICLKCGDSGHDLFSCKNNYSADDLKEIQCYICKSFGHLCCAKYPDSSAREFSCYRCGLRGHTGLACTASRGEASGTGSLNPCYRCGEEGHFARECTYLSKVNKRNHELSTPKKKDQKKRKERKEVRSVPRDLGRALKKKGKNDHEDYPQPNTWRSPSTPRNKRAKISNFSSGGHASVPHLSRVSNRLDTGNSASYGSGTYHHHRFAASGGFDNSASNGSGTYHHRRFAASGDIDSSASYGSGSYHHHRFAASGGFDSPASYGSGTYHHHRFAASGGFDSPASYGSGTHHHHRFAASGGFDSPASYGSGQHHHYNRFSASRFGNSSHDGWRRNNDW